MMPFMQGLVVAVAAVAAVGSADVLHAQDLERQAVVVAVDQGVLVDFQDAELRFVISALAEAGGLNVVYGELPSKLITLRMRRPVPRDDIPPLLRSIAQSNGLRVTEDGGVLHVEGADPRGGNSVRGGGESADTADIRLFVYRLKHARAPKLASTLQSLFGGSQGMAQGQESRRPTLTQRLRDQQILPTDPPVVMAPSDPRPAVVAIAPSALPGRLGGEVQIVPDETTNSLLIRADSADWEVLQQAILSLDLRPLQVVIEVLIAEVRRTSDLELGVSATVTDNRSAGDGITGTGELKASTTGDFVLNILRSGNVDVNVAISALAARGDVRILSRPVIFAQNNLEARILVGAQRPFVQVFRSLPTDAGVRDQVVQYRDVGTSLTIVPTINPDGYVNLQLSQEVSTATSETQFGAPVISTREASTYMFVRDGQTGVIGGLVDRQQDRSRTGIPLLSRIPILGALFGTTRASTINSELFLFLTPHIVATDEDADRVRRGIEQRDGPIHDELRRAPVVVPLRGEEPPPPPDAQNPSSEAPSPGAPNPPPASGQ